MGAILTVADNFSPNAEPEPGQRTLTSAGWGLTMYR